MSRRLDGKAALVTGADAASAARSPRGWRGRARRSRCTIIGATRALGRSPPRWRRAGKGGHDRRGSADPEACARVVRRRRRAARPARHPRAERRHRQGRTGDGRRRRRHPRDDRGEPARGALHHRGGGARDAPAAVRPGRRPVLPDRRARRPCRGSARTPPRRPASVGFVKTLANELSPRADFTANVVSPGVIATDMSSLGSRRSAISSAPPFPCIASASPATWRPPSPFSSPPRRRT